MKRGLVNADCERAGVEVVGCFEDGMPLTLKCAANGLPLVNDTAGVGIDPVIGQGPSTLPQTWLLTCGSSAGGLPSLFGGFVTLKGGEYFYAPSLGGLKAL